MQYSDDCILTGTVGFHYKYLRPVLTAVRFAHVYNLCSYL